MGLPIKETVVGQTYVLPALISLQVNVSMEGKEGVSKAELFQLLLGVEYNCMPAVLRSLSRLGSWFLHDAAFAVLPRWYCESSKANKL